jgi:hypothetical protein
MMQGFALNDVVAERLPQENVSMPVEVKDALGDLWRRIGTKKKWAAYTAAILAFYRLPVEEQYQAMDAVEAARRRKNFGPLLGGSAGRFAKDDDENDLVIQGRRRPRPKNGPPK